MNGIGREGRGHLKRVGGGRRRPLCPAVSFAVGATCGSATSEKRALLPAGQRAAAWPRDPRECPYPTRGEKALHIRSPRTALGYIGRDDLRLFDEEGFVDTGDMVEQAGERCFFKGRRAGTINVGGLKVHPEEVERIINMHDGVRMSRVFARRNPIVGDLIVAEIVLTDEGAAREAGAVLQEVLGACRAELARHMVPATIRVVPALDVLASGKLARAHA
jgi:acyl-coenzyme A synthetase/AMP-(fatty) acid ligase